MRGRFGGDQHRQHEQSRLATPVIMAAADQPKRSIGTADGNRTDRLSRSAALHHQSHHHRR